MRILVGCLVAAIAWSGAALAQDASQVPVPPPVASGPQATIETSIGTIVLALDSAHAPKTVANFIRYAREKHFDGTVVYRVQPSFVIQAGSYRADGSAKPGHDGIPLEAGVPNTRGSVAMAHGDDPNSAQAEFFIDLADAPSLDRHADDANGTTGFAVFGHVVSGMDVVDKIAAVPTGGTGPMAPGVTPLAPVTIEKVTIAN
jgi:cyclophilin family peptidyl-prolyl cis-trans isomerase